MLYCNFCVLTVEVKNIFTLYLVALASYFNFYMLSEGLQ